jgi:hypothetical protein
MKRRNEEASIARREWRRHRSRQIETKLSRGRFDVDAFAADAPCDEQIGRFRKRKAFDCGNARCPLCHGHKYPKREPTRDELASKRDLREQLAQL